jgi:multicomponent Na+:H+ antiporter subunit D
MMFVSHAFLIAALFLVGGVLLAEQGTIDELRMRTRPCRDRVLAAVWFAAAIGLVGAPYVGTYLGHALIDEAASDGGRHWVQPFLWLGAALTSGALLRAGGRSFLGLGAADAPFLGEELDEEPVERDVMGPLLRASAVAAVALGLVVSVAPGLGQRAVAAADRFRDRAGYANTVLHGRPTRIAHALPYAIRHTTLESVLYGAAALLLALVFALAGLYGHRLPARAKLFEPPVLMLKRLHSGVVGDYVAWLLVGTAVFGGIWALTLH